MAYSMKRFPNDEAEFPTPPLYLVWYADTEVTYDRAPDGAYKRDANGRFIITGTTVKDTGQVRHLPTLEKCKKQIYTVGNGNARKFAGDWAVYRWENDRYVLKYEGGHGEWVIHNPLYAKGVAKDGTQGTPRDLLDDEIDEALQSIAQAVRK